MAKFKPFKKECETCGKMFVAIRKWHRFCHARCRVAGWKLKHPTVTPDVLEDIEKIKKKLGIK